MSGQNKLTFLTKCFIILYCTHSAKVQDLESDRLLAELELDDLELVDLCEDLAFARKSAVLNQDYRTKIEQEQRYGSVLKTHYDVLREFTEVPTELERNWTYQVKPGDSLLPQDKWNKLVSSQNHIEELASRSKLFFQNQSELCVNGKSDYQNILQNERKYENLKNVWRNWQNIYNYSEAEFANQLGLVKKAATLNGFEKVQEYWEALIDFEGAYERADVFWEEISPFYKKLQQFVRTRLFKYYNLETGTKEIPAFLLGGDLGTDWSNIADIILPHPQIHFDAKSYLKHKDIKTIYKYSENVTTGIGLGPLGNKFWKNCNFNSSACGAQLYEFCGQGYTEIIDCNKTSWPIYLNSHETAAKIAMNNLDYISLPRQQLRYCSIDDAVEKLASLLAIENLECLGILTPNANKSDDDPVQMTKLLLTALRVMPGLTYSIMADKWRIDIIENNSSNIAESWWKYRKEYTGVQGFANKEQEYLEDSRIVSNKPYVNTFFGTLIAFQLLSFYKERAEDSYNLVDEFGKDDTFITMVKSRHSSEWPYLLSIHYGLDLGTTEILKYFEPLERYFETAPLDQVVIVTTTTTTATTTTTEKLPTSKLESSLDSEIVNDQPKVNASLNLGELNGNAAVDLGDSHIAMYVGVGILMAVGCLLAIAFGYKTIRRKRRTNNRRFDA